jgi:hypothetical protein
VNTIRFYVATAAGELSDAYLDIKEANDLWRTFYRQIDVSDENVYLVWEIVKGSHVPDTGIYDIKVSKNGTTIEHFEFSSSTNTHNFKAHNTFDLPGMTLITNTGSYDGNGLSITNGTQTSGTTTLITSPGTYYIHYDGSKHYDVVGHTTYIITPLITVGSAPAPNPLPHVQITNVSEVISSEIKVSGTVFSSVANITGVRAAVFPYEYDMESLDTSNVATFVNTNGTLLTGITADRYAVGNVSDFALSTYFSNIDAGYTTGSLVNDNSYSIAMSALDNIGRIGLGLFKMLPPFIRATKYRITLESTAVDVWTNSIAQRSPEVMFSDKYFEPTEDYRSTRVEYTSNYPGLSDGDTVQQSYADSGATFTYDITYPSDTPLKQLYVGSTDDMPLNNSDMWNKKITIQYSTDNGASWNAHSVIDWANVPDGTPNGPTKATSVDGNFPWALDKSVSAHVGNKSFPNIGFQGKQIIRFDQATGTWYHYKAYGYDRYAPGTYAESQYYPKVDGGVDGTIYPYTFTSASWGSYNVPASEYAGLMVY